MTPGKWYFGKLREKLLVFDAGDGAYIREAFFKNGPLAVGRVWILFDPRRQKLIRFADSLGVTNVLRLHPNNVNPLPAPPARNEEIEEAYRIYLRNHPLPKRVRNPKFIRDRAEALNSLTV